ncbi:hypothetical protein [Flavobacterium aestuarii]
MNNLPKAFLLTLDDDAAMSSCFVVEAFRNFSAGAGKHFRLLNKN